MNKYLYYKKRIIKKIAIISKKYNCEFQFVDNINSNACVINFESKYIIFINKNIEKNILPLVIFHEIGHIKFKTISNNPKKYNRFIEGFSNIFAIYNLKFGFNFFQNLIFFLEAIISEKKLYMDFSRKNQLGGNYIYEWISKIK